MFYEKISKQEVDAMERTDSITPRYRYEDYVIVRNDETGEILEEYFTNLTIEKTADEVYEESLLPVETPTDKISVLEGEVLDLTEQNIDMDFRLLMIEFSVI